MNNETRKILDKILSTIRKDPNGMLFDKFNKICLEYGMAPMYVLDFFMRFGLINTSNKQYFELTEKGVRFEGFESLEKSDKIAKSKARLEHRLLNFQVKTFWGFFILALFSSYYSIYDLSKDSQYYTKTEIEKMLKNYEKVEKHKNDMIHLYDDSYSDSIQINKKNSSYVETTETECGN